MHLAAPSSIAVQPQGLLPNECFDAQAVSLVDEG